MKKTLFSFLKVSFFLGVFLISHYVLATPKSNTQPKVVQIVFDSNEKVEKEEVDPNEQEALNRMAQREQESLKLNFESF